MNTYLDIIEGHQQIEGYYSCGEWSRQWIQPLCHTRKLLIKITG